jgi:HD superfamily phosphodiesterase
MRAVHYYVGQPSALHVPDGDADQPESAIQHFHDKLLHIRERMKTAPGKQMAEKRHQLVRTAHILFSLLLLTLMTVCRSWSTFWLP